MRVEQPDLWWDGDDALWAPADLEHLNKIFYDLCWSPYGRMLTKRRLAGTELRHLCGLGGRDIEDVPLPD